MERFGLNLKSIGFWVRAGLGSLLKFIMRSMDSNSKVVAKIYLQIHFRDTRGNMPLSLLRIMKTMSILSKFH